MGRIRRVVAAMALSRRRRLHVLLLLFFCLWSRVGQCISSLLVEHLPEQGQQVAKAAGRLRIQFRVTAPGPKLTGGKVSPADRKEKPIAFSSNADDPLPGM
jgi:hypothetical protein